MATSAPTVGLARPAGWRLVRGGSFILRDGRNCPLPLRGRKARAIVAFLAAHAGEHVSRDRLIELLWAERGEAQARGSLRQSLLEIRRVAPGLVSTEFQHLWIDPHRLRIVRSDESSANEILFKDLDGISPAFDEWLRFERHGHAAAEWSTLQRKVEAMLSRNEGAAALPFIERMQRIDPYNEDALRLAMRAEFQAARPAAIQTRFKEVAVLLEKELNVCLSGETRALHDELLAELSLLLPSRQKPGSNGQQMETNGALVGSGDLTFLERWRREIGLATAAAIGLALLPFIPFPQPDVRAVVIQPADGSTAAQAAAHDLLVRLTTLQAANAGLLRLQRADPGAEVKADLVFEAAASRDPRKTSQSVALLDGKDRAVLWSQDFVRSTGNAADLRLQVAYTAARVLQCALEALPPGARRLDQPTLKLYVNGCARLVESYGTGAASVIPVFTKVIEQSPEFRPGWARLLLAEVSVGMQTADRKMELLARRHISEARKLHPDIAEATLLEAAWLPLHSYEQALKLLDMAKQQDPNNPTVLSHRADQLRTVGRMQESIEDAKRAVDLEPLSPWTRSWYVLALAYAGRVDAARKELQSLEQIWPGTGILQEVKFRFHLRFGDPKIALEMAKSLNIGGENQERFLVARANPTAQNIDLMISHARREGNGSSFLGFMAQALGEFDRNDQLFELLNNWPNQDDVRSLGDVYFRPALHGFRHDVRFMRIAAKASLVSYWRRSGHWPDFCSEPDLPYKCNEAASGFTLVARS